jgi:dihydrofolate reductase
MAKLVARAITISLDGYTSALHQSLENPFGVGGMKLMDWAFATRTFCKMFGKEGGTTGLDDSYLSKADEGIGATLMGRNMFGPIRGPWINDDWKGWWGPNPPYHHPVVVLSHHERQAIPMEGGTTFHFVTEGLQAGVKRAFDEANGKDVRVGGGCQTLRQCLKHGLLDELHLVVVPKLLGNGERLFDGTDEAAKQYECVEFKSSEAANHIRLRKKA